MPILKQNTTHPYQRNANPSRGGDWTRGKSHCDFHAVYFVNAYLKTLPNRDRHQCTDTRYAPKAWSPRTSPTSAHRAARALTQKEHRRTFSSHCHKVSGTGQQMITARPLAPSPPTPLHGRTCSLSRFCSQRFEAIHDEVHFGLQTSTGAGIWRRVIHLQTMQKH